MLGREDGSSLAGHVVGDYHPHHVDDGVIAKSRDKFNLVIPTSILNPDKQFKSRSNQTLSP